MPKINPEVEAFARITVVGVGGSGRNAINHMVNSKVKGVEFIVMNTDAQDLHHSLAKRKIHIGKNLTRGLGTGMNADLGKRAAEETKEEIQEALKGSDMVFIAGGMGGGTGTGASPVIARTAKELGALTVAVVTKPFFFEGAQRMRLAESGLEELRKEVDALIVIPNDRLLATVNKETTMKNAFAMSDEILRQAVEGISDLVTTPGIINVDFADIRSVMQNAGSALMGIGSAGGDKRAEEAARAAINSPLLDLSINGAKGVLFSVSGGDDITLFEVQEAAKVITESIDPEAKVIFGTTRDERVKKNEIRVTVIATSFPEFATKKAMFGDHRAHRAPEPLDKPISKIEKDEKGKIYNGLLDSMNIGGVTKSGTPTAPSPTEAAKEPPKEVPKATTPTPPAIDEDDEWAAVPAFLRRNRNK